MTRFGIAGAAILAVTLATSLALAEDGHHGTRDGDHADRMAEFSQIQTAFCKDHYAQAAARVAYLEAKLSLTPSQQPLFATWRDAVLQSAQTRANECASESAPHRHGDLLAREAREESRLEARLAALQAEKPALTSLYQSLSDQQKRAFEHGGHHEHGMWMHHGDRDGGGDRHGDRGHESDDS